MAANNLRIIYQNIVDLSTSTITASSTAVAGNTPVSNMKLDSKSLVWRSSSVTTAAVNGLYTAKANLVVTMASTNIGGVILPFCNLSSAATIRVRGYTGTAPTLGGTVDSPTTAATGTLRFDSGVVMACPYQVLGLWNWGTLPLGVNSYSYGGGTYGRVWIPLASQAACTSLLIEIVDSQNQSPYIEASRLVIGSYWYPKYNTSFGLSSTTKDLSAHTRTESGDLVTNRGISYRSMNFDLKYLVPSDRLEFTRILRGNGLPRPLVISLFPDNTEDWDKEQAHQIYGKLSQLPDLVHPMFEIYSTTVDIEEI
ncbi:hypothetical protein EB001_02015 [bacterium]|nr:hypothetical protein [bacterium]